MKNGNQDWRPITLDRAFSKSTKNMLVFTAAKRRRGGSEPVYLESFARQHSAGEANAHDRHGAGGNMMLTLTLDEAAAAALATVIRQVSPAEYGVDAPAWYRALDALSPQLTETAAAPAGDPPVP
jgi:hypothetical protein